MKNTALALFIVLVAWTNTEVSAADSVPVGHPLTRLTDTIYVIYGPFDLPNQTNRGFRNNPVIVLTSDGPVVFDPGGSAWAGDMVVERVREITRAPIVAVFNSHAHGDHWLGNEGVRRAYPNVPIYGHPAMKAKAEGPDGRTWLSTIGRLTGGTAGGQKVVAPDRAVKDGEVIAIGDTRFRIHHTGAAHTDNDIMIEIVGQDALFMGDVVRNGLLGIMESDASFRCNVQAIDTILARRFKHYIPGHGRVGGPEMVRVYRTYLATLLESVESLYDEGLSDYEMKPKVVEKLASYKDWAGFDLRVGAHISRAYLEVEA